MDVGPHRDIVGDLANSIRTNTSLKFGLYHSLFEWFNPMYLNDKQQSFEDNLFVVNKVGQCNVLDKFRIIIIAKLSQTPFLLIIIIN